MNDSQYWYQKAKEKVESFLFSLDPLLSVSALTVEVTEWVSGRKYATPALYFDYPTNPELRWTMQIGESDEYIDLELEGIVKKLYFENKDKAPGL